MPGTSPLGGGLRQRALRDVVTQVVIRVANLALGVVVTALLARTLGDAGFGQWMTILTMLQLLSFFTSLGMDAVAVREAAANPEQTGTWVGALVLTRLALTLPSMAVALVALLYVQEDATMLIAGVVLLLQFPFSTATSLQIVYQLQMRNTLPMILLTINSVAWGVCVLVIDLRGGGLIALAVALTIITAVTASLQAAASLRLLGARLQLSRTAVIALLKVGAPLGLAGLLVNAYSRIDQVIVYKQAGATAAGLYGSVYRVLEQAHFVPISLMTTLAPLIASLWPSNRERMLHVVSLAARLLAIGSLGALAFASVAAKPILRLIFGEEFVPAANALPVLGGAFVVICFGYLVGNLLLVFGLIHRQVVIGVIGLVVNVIGNLLLVPRYGYMAAAWMTLVTELAVVGTGAWFVLRHLGSDRLELELSPLLRVGVAAVALGGGLAACAAAGAGLPVLVPVACLLYPGLLLGLGAISVEDVRDAAMRRPEQV